jgi:hypothetical protein
VGQTDFDYGHNVKGDVPTYDQACMGMMVCPHCGKAAICGDVVSNLPTEDNNSMIPRGNNQASGNQRGKGQRNGLPFLSTKDATQMRQPARIVAARVEDDTFRPGSQVVALKLNYKGQLWLYNLRTNNPALDALVNGFGEDELTWAEKDIVIFNEEDNFNGKLWLRMEPVSQPTEEQATAAKKNARR